MFSCPNCKTVLKRVKSRFGIFWVCPACKGRAITLEVIRKVIPKQLVNKLWQRTLSGEFMQKRNCPSCVLPMSEIPLSNNEHTVYLDVCPKCHIIWFDNNEYQQLPKIPVEAGFEDKLTPQQREKLAVAEIEFYKEKQEFEDELEKTSDGLIDLIFPFWKLLKLFI